LEQTGSGNGNHSSQLGMFHSPQLVALAEFAVLFLEFAPRIRYGWGLGRSGHQFRDHRLLLLCLFRIHIDWQNFAVGIAQDATRFSTDLSASL